MVNVGSQQQCSSLPQTDTDMVVTFDPKINGFPGLIIDISMSSLVIPAAAV